MNRNKKTLCGKMAAMIVLALTLAGCRGDVQTYEKHIDDVQQETQTSVVVE